MTTLEVTTSTVLVCAVAASICCSVVTRRVTTITRLVQQPIRNAIANRVKVSFISSLGEAQG
jgi:hypothetical protein